MSTRILQTIFALLSLLYAPLGLQAQAVDSVATDTAVVDTAWADSVPDYLEDGDDAEDLNNVDFKIDVPESWTMTHSDSLAYNYLFQRAMSLFGQNNGAAFDILCQCQQLNPRAAEAYYFLAPFFGYLGNDSLMQAGLKAAVDLDPTNKDYLTGLLNAYNKEGLFEESVKVAEDILSKTDDKLPVLQMLVELYYNTDQKEKVLKTLDKIELMGGGSDELTLARAQFLEEMGRHKQARQVYDELIRKNPNDESFRLKLANYLVNG